MAVDAKDENTLDSTWNCISLHGLNNETAYVSETNFAHTSNKDFVKSVNIKILFYDNIYILYFNIHINFTLTVTVTRYSCLF